MCIQNLSRAFPQLSYQDIARRRHQFYNNLGRLLWQMAFPGTVKLHLSKEAETILRSISCEARPAVLLLGHYGNWEILSQLPKHTDMPIQALYKPLKNKMLDRYLYNRRGRHGIRLLPAQQALRILLREKCTASVTFFIADQFPGHGKGIPVSFLDQPTGMFAGGEQLARRLDAYVGYVELKPKGKHGWKLDIKPICLQAAQTEEGQITKTFTQLLEQSIRTDPSWWLWTHRRWK